MAETQREQLTAAMIADSDLGDALGKLWPLTFFARDSLLLNQYSFPDAFADSLPLSVEGNELESLLKQQFPQAQAGDLRAALLAVFAHRTLLIDVKASNAEALRTCLSHEVANTRIRYPFIFGRLLYDKYYSSFADRTTKPTYETTQSLLSGTPQGVFQVHNVVSGPFGLLISSASRFITPTQNAPLAHCRNPGCEHVHAVSLMSGQTYAGQMYQYLTRRLTQEAEDTPDWAGAIGHLLFPADDFMADINTGDLLWFIGNALNDSELRALLTSLLTGHAATLRATLGAVQPSINKHDAATMAATWESAQLLQAAALLSDTQIATAVEDLLRKQVIVVPKTETRSALVFRPARGAFHQRTQLSQYGLRFVSTTDLDLAVPRLRALVRKLHTNEALQWSLLSQGTSFEEKLEALLNEGNLPDTVEKYLLSTEALFHGTEAYLGYAPLPIPGSEVEVKRLINEVLWKLGFAVGMYPPWNTTIRRRLTRLRDFVELLTLGDEESVEACRGAAASAFVALEETLDLSLAFSSWALLSDHYSRARRMRFRFNLSEARLTMEAFLNGASVEGSDALVISGSGKTNFYGLVHGFEVLASVCSEVLKDAANVKYHRPEEQRPRQAGISGVMQFPFEHTIALLDLAEGAQQLLLQGLKTVTKILVSGDVMGVRNRIPHGGREFPRKANWLVAITAAEEAVACLEETGLGAPVFNPINSRSDPYSRELVTLSDYRGRELHLYRPSELVGCDLPAEYSSQIILVKSQIAGTGERLRFNFEEDSAWTKMWADYPRGRSALGHDDSEVVDLSNAASAERQGVSVSPA